MSDLIYTQQDRCNHWQLHEWIWICTLVFFKFVSFTALNLGHIWFSQQVEDQLEPRGGPYPGMESQLFESPSKASTGPGWSSQRSRLEQVEGQAEAIRGSGFNPQIYGNYRGWKKWWREVSASESGSWVSSCRNQNPPQQAQLFHQVYNKMAERQLGNNNTR